METTSTQVTREIIVGKFAGAFSRFQLGAFNDLIWCQVPRRVAHKIATDFGSDFGRLMATDAEFAAKVGKADKNGNSKLTVSGGGKISTSRTMSIVRVSQQIYNLNKEGLIVARELPQLSKTLAEYYQECVDWVETQNWAPESE